MNKKALRVVAALSLITISTGLSAQKGIDTGTPFGSGEDSVRCVQNTILYSGYLEKQEHDSALYYWRQVFSECPASSEDIYVSGEWIFKALFNTTGDSSYIDSVIMVMSLRTFYFDKKPSNDLAISQYLSEYGGSNPFYTELCYSLLREVADSAPGYIDDSSAVILVEAAAKAFSAAIIDTTQVLTAYLKAEEIINDHLKITPDDTRYTEAAERIMSLFRSSGAMTCTGIETIYSARVEEDIRDTLLLNEV
ncbi:MAG: hypothetical protein MUC78_10545, partial [Bacteroidales bacterium]|nr:hypothetical protein [Bacteroidales bacterium]